MTKQKKGRPLNLKVLGGIIIILLVFVFLILYQFFGLKYYLSAISSIKTATLDNQKFAKDIFYGPKNNIYLYNGTLGFITTNNNYLAIWIWGKNGLRYYLTDSKTFFSNYRICLGDEWKTGSGTVKKNINIGVKEWLSLVRKGDFVGVELSNDHKTTGVFSYDWWIFAPFSKDTLIKTCQNR